MSPAPYPAGMSTCGVPLRPSQLSFSPFFLTFKELDYETKNQYILKVTVVNEVEFSVILPTATAMITVNVSDKNEPPVFVPPELRVSKPEDLSLGQTIAQYTAQDPDKFLQQTLRYGAVQRCLFQS